MPRTETRKTARVVVTLTQEQAERVRTKARRLGMVASEWSRAVIIADLLQDDKAARRDGQAA